MEKELDSGFHFQRPEWQSSYLNIISDPLIAAGQNPLPVCLNPYMNPAYGIPPLGAYSGLPQFKASQTNASSNRFYGLPRYGQAFASPLSSMPKDALASEQMRYDSQKAGPANGRKRFLVFDQSGDQTTVIYSSPVGAPVQYLTPWNPELPTTSRFTKEDLILKRDKISQYSPLLNVDHIEENPGDDLHSEMHEDTEEINALLYSDDEGDDSDNDEVTSTGHSPSTLTDHCISQCPEEDDGEVASSASPFKRQKLGECNLIMKAGDSEKPFNSSKFEDDAESGCGNFDNQVEGKCFSGKKRSRNDKVRETVSILRNIIPGVKGKDALVVIDEAIHYLKSLKAKVQSVGLEVV